MTWTPAPKGMETRAKDLKDFTMWNCTNSSVKFFDFCDAFFPKNLFFGGDFAVSSSQIYGKRFSKLNHKFTVPSFNDEIGRYLPTQIEQSMPRNHPFVTISSKEFVPSFFKRCRTCSGESFLKPMEKSYISIRNLKNTPIMAILIAIPRFIFKLTGMKTSFSINNASKIGKMNRIVNFRNVFNSVLMVNVVELHNTSNVTGSTSSVHLKCI